MFVYLLQSNLTHISRSEYVPGIGLGIAKCPYDPLDNSTAIYVENGNPGGLPALVSCSFVVFLLLLHVCVAVDVVNRYAFYCVILLYST